MTLPAARRVRRPVLATSMPVRRSRFRVEVFRLDDPTERIGEFYVSAAQVRAELDRIDGRWLSLKRAAAQHLEPDDELRAALIDTWGAWRAFYADAYDDWLAWATNVAEGDRYDREADDYRAALAARGISVGNPTSSRTSPRPELPGFGLGAGLGAGLGVVALAALGLYLVTR